MALRAVTFDLWETLIADSPQLNCRRTDYRIAEIGKILTGNGLGLPSAELERAHQSVWEECARSWERAVDLPYDRQVSLFLDLARPGLSSDIPENALKRVCAIYAEAVLLFPPSPVSGAVRAVSELKARGLKIGLICNTGRTPGFVLRRLLSGYGIMPLIDAALFSDETIVRKPDPRIFRLAMDKLGSSPETSVHIGDSLENDVRGAQGAGMRAVWINGAGPSDPAPAPVAATVASVPTLLADW
jgi:putative hydrolase of the HAD superfamily